MTVFSILFALVTLAFGVTPVEAQLTRPTMFPSRGTCVMAMESGNFNFYEPRYFGNRRWNPSNGMTKVVAPLEADVCLHMVTTSGWQWIIQRAGTLLRWNINAEGSRVPYARDDCGNAIDEIAYPSTTLAPRPLRGETGPQGPIGPVGPAGRDFTRFTENRYDSDARSRRSTMGKVAAVAVGIAAIWVGLKIINSDRPHNQGPGVTSDSVAVRCNAIGYPNTCPTSPSQIGDVDLILSPMHGSIGFSTSFSLTTGGRRR